MPLPDFAEQLVKNITSALVETKGTAFGNGLLARATEGMHTQQAARVASCSPRTVQRARKRFREGKRADLKEKWVSRSPLMRRRKVSTAEEEATGTWIKEQCPMKSGGRYHMQYCGCDYLYAQYRTAILNSKIVWARPKQEEGKEEEKAPKPRCREVFERIKKKQKIRVVTSYQGHFECLKCVEVKEIGADLIEWEQRAENEAKAGGVTEPTLKTVNDLKAQHQKLKEHSLLYAKQNAYLMQIRHEEIENQRNGKRVLVVMDFSKFNMRPNVGLQTKEKAVNPEWVHDMVMVFESWLIRHR